MNERAAKTRTGIYLWKVEGGIPGSMHHRGSEWYATEEEAQARIDSDTYPAMHPAAGPGIMLGCEQVELTPPIVSACVKAAKAGQPVSAWGELERVLRGMRLATLGDWNEQAQTHPLVLTALGERVAEQAGAK